MLKRFVEYVLDLLNTARDTRSNKEAIAQLRKEFDELTKAVERISFQLRGLREEERLEREKLVLQIENALLRMEKRLPSSPDVKKRK